MRKAPPHHGLIVSDLMFGLTAILLLVMALASPQIGAFLPQLAPYSAEPSVDSLQILADKRSVILATENGLQIQVTDSQSQFLSLNTLTTAPELPPLTPPVLVAITPQGKEAAFLFESRAANAGVTAVELLFLPQDCPTLSRVASGYRCQ